MKNYNFQDVIDFLKKENLYGSQVFNSLNTVGDVMTNVYHKDGIIVDYCRNYDYIEVFGLEDEDFKVLEDAYAEVEKELWLAYQTALANRADSDDF